jgi:hypothetical protein
MRELALIEDNPDTRLLPRAILGSTYHITEHESSAPGLEAVSGNAERPVALSRATLV